jgi:hypothetical protein
LWWCSDDAGGYLAGHVGRTTRACGQRRAGPRNQAAGRPTSRGGGTPATCPRNTGGIWSWSRQPASRPRPRHKVRCSSGMRMPGLRHAMCSWALSAPPHDIESREMDPRWAAILCASHAECHRLDSTSLGPTRVQGGLGMTTTSARTRRARAATSLKARRTAAGSGAGARPRRSGQGRPRPRGLTWPRSSCPCSRCVLVGRVASSGSFVILPFGKTAMPVYFLGLFWRRCTMLMCNFGVWKDGNSCVCVHNGGVAPALAAYPGD